MRFIPKVKKHFFHQHYIEILGALTLIMIYNMVVLNPMKFQIQEQKSYEDGVITDKSGVSYDKYTHEEINAFKILVDQEVIGYVSLDTDAKTLFEGAVKEFTSNPANSELVVDKQLVIIPSFISGDQALSNADQIKSRVTGYLLANRASLKTEAYQVKIGDDFSIFVKNLDEVEAILQGSQKKYVKDVNYFGVLFDESTETGQINPVVYKKRISSDTKTLRTVAPAINIENTFVAEAVDRTLMEADLMPENLEIGVIKNETIEVNFAENIVIEKSMASEEEIMTAAEGTVAVTKENEKPDTYAVQQNDCLSTIAGDHGMSVEELTTLNPGVEDQKYLNIDQELVVMVPQSELSINTVQKQVYNVSIDRSVTYVDDASLYVNDSKTVTDGSDGVKQITAIVQVANGAEASREVISEEIILEPIAKVVAKGTKARPVTSATGNYINPNPAGKVTSTFGPRWGSFHEGIDLASPTGTPVRAADGGTIIRAGWNGTYGYCIDIDHGNNEITRYAHLSSMLVNVGEKVAQGETIGKVGNTGRSTGSHLHFEIRVNDVAKNPYKYIF